MQRIKFDSDIMPLSEVRKKITGFIKQVHDTKRPLVITHRGKSAAVLVDVNEYEIMQQKIELIADIRTSLGQLRNGEGLSHEEARAKLLEVAEG